MGQSPLTAGDLAPGQMLGRYELLMPIATGGMGNVWAARLKGSHGFRKLVAIKTILRSAEDAQVEQMLLQEASLASQIHHPNVVETLELGEHHGVMYLVMEYVHGESLRCIMREALPHGGIPLPITVNLIGQVCRGLQAAHDLCDDDGNPMELVHRDISPQNILVTYSGTVKIVDFGVATTSADHANDSGEIKGKIPYLAPEQLRAEPLDGRVDVFTTGILLYHLAVGRHPFRGDTPKGTIDRIVADGPAAPPSAMVEEYPTALEEVLLRALQKDRDARWQTAADFLDALYQAMPEAFGPGGEKAVVEYLHGLLRDRMLAQRSTLRMAEDTAEKSAPCNSDVSVPPVATSGEAAAKPPRKLPLAIAAGVAALGAAAAVTLSHQPPTQDAITQEPGAQQPPAAPEPPSGAAVATTGTGAPTRAVPSASIAAKPTSNAYLSTEGKVAAATRESRAGVKAKAVRAAERSGDSTVRRTGHTAASRLNRGSPNAGGKSRPEMWMPSELEESQQSGSPPAWAITKAAVPAGPPVSGQNDPKALPSQVGRSRPGPVPRLEGRARAQEADNSKGGAAD